LRDAFATFPDARESLEDFVAEVRAEWANLTGLRRLGLFTAPSR